MQLVHKILDFAVERVDETARTFWAVASTGQVDRQGDLIEAAGWDFANFLKNPVIPWAHDYAAPPVAKALAVKVEAGRLLFQAQFPTAAEYAFADTIYQLYRGSYLRAFSVGFAPVESEVVVHSVGGRALTGTRYLRQELYEISCVTLPANPQALAQLAMKSGATRATGAAGPANPLIPSPQPAGQRPRDPHPAPAVAAAAKSALGRAALAGLVASRLRYHLGL